MNAESNPPRQDSLKACKFSLLGRIYFSVSVFEDTPPPSLWLSLALSLSLRKFVSLVQNERVALHLSLARSGSAALPW